MPVRAHKIQKSCNDKLRFSFWTGSKENFYYKGKTSLNQIQFGDCIYIESFGRFSFLLCRSLTDDVSMSCLSWQIYGVLGDRPELLSHCDDIARPVTKWWHIQTPVKQDKGCLRVMRSAEPELSCCVNTVCWVLGSLLSNASLNRCHSRLREILHHVQYVCLWAFMHVIEILPMHVWASACMRKPSLHSQWYEPSVFTHVCWQPPFSSSHSSLSVVIACNKWDMVCLHIKKLLN